jgi:4'-phosphopantetheinyl transferase
MPVQPAAQPPTLPDADEVHLWRVGLLADAPRLAELLTALSPPEQRRAARFRHDRDRRRYVVAHGELRRLLAAYVRQQPTSLVLRAGRRGKPELRAPHHAGLRFNIAHADDIALVGVTRGRDIGVDLERLDRTVAAEELAARFFSPAELAFLKGLPAARRGPAFIRLWTCKEAFAKGTGAGIAGAQLDSFTVSLQNDRPRLHNAEAGTPDPTAGWTLLESAVANGYAAAVAVAGTVARLRLFEWPPAPKT